MSNNPDNPYRTEFIKYCPNCKGDLRPEASIKRPSESSSRFRCDDHTE
jgi:hypothetical protein